MTGWRAQDIFVLSEGLAAVNASAGHGALPSLAETVRPISRALKSLDQREFWYTERRLTR